MKWHITFLVFVKRPMIIENHFLNSRWQTFCQNVMQWKVFLDLFNTIWFRKSFLELWINTSSSSEGINVYEHELSDSLHFMTLIRNNQRSEHICKLLISVMFFFSWCKTCTIKARSVLFYRKILFLKFFLFAPTQPEKLPTERFPQKVAKCSIMQLHTCESVVSVLNWELGTSDWALRFW